MNQLRSDILSWGNIPAVQHRYARPHFIDELRSVLRLQKNGHHGILATGLRRSYGDSCLNGDGNLVDMSGMDHFVQLDAETGILVAEAGVSIADVLRIAIPAGYFLPVTPGTKFVTLGGAIANDVHGKNHHVAGTFGRWILQLDLLRTDGSEYSLTRADPTGLFEATIGGLGLTGVITRVVLKLMPIPSSIMEVETIPFAGVEEFFALADDSETNFDYTVAWIDCLAKGKNLGRGIFTRARHSLEGPRQPVSRRNISVPVFAPSYLLNRFSLAAFNKIYYRLAGRARSGRVPYEFYFYPLDAIGHWNRLYGRQGFFQYQSVVPPRDAKAATSEMLRTIAASGQGSFLAVLKTFGSTSSPGLLSFPMKGATLALDFPNRGAETRSLLSKLDEIVDNAGGRLYPAKDGRIPPNLFQRGYPGLANFLPHKDPGLSSSFWRRMGL